MTEPPNQEAEHRKHREYLVSLRSAVVHREAILRIVDASEGSEQAKSEIMLLLGIDEMAAIGVLNLRLKDLSRDRLSALDERIREISRQIQDDSTTAEGSGRGDA